MTDELKFHLLSALGAEQGVFIEGLEKELSKGLSRKNSKSPWVRWQSGRKYLRDVFTHVGVADVGVQAVVTDALKAFWKYVLNHLADKAK